MLMASVLWIVALFSGVILRFLLRSRISAKAWKKYAGNSALRRWFLWDFRGTISCRSAFWIHIVGAIGGTLFFIVTLAANLCRFELLENIFLTLLMIDTFLLFDTLCVVWLGVGKEEESATYSIIKTVALVLLIGVTAFVCGAIIYGWILDFIASF